MKLLVKTLSILIIFLCLCHIYVAESIEFNPKTLPLSWRVQQTVDVPSTNLPQISANFGGNIMSLKNIIIDAAGTKLQINLIEAASDQHAESIYQKLLSIRQNELFCIRRSTSVVEFVCQNNQIIKKAHDLLGLNSRLPTEWNVQFSVAPIKSSDYMLWNVLFNQLIAYQNNPNDPQLIKKIEELTQSFVFSDNFTLRTIRNSYGEPQYTFANTPAKITNAGDVTTYNFVNSTHVLNIPSIDVKAIIPVRAFESYMPTEDIDTTRLIAATPFWPADNKGIINFINQLLTNLMTPEQKLETILAWMNKTIQFKGELVGSRYGVMQVMKQGYGHCWDKSDVFITLSRAAGIPARQVYGWLHGVSGHVWAEVFVPEKGWISLDPTTSWLGTSEDYIPFSISEEGNLSFIYWDFPKISK